MKTPKTTNKNTTEHKCALCPYSTKILQCYQIHVRVHSTEKPFKCPKCPFKSKWEKSVKIHLRTVHNTESRPFPCPHPGCSYAGKQRGNLDGHSKTHAEKSFLCSHPNCDFSTNRRDNLTVHTRRHTGERPFVCQFESCSYAAPTRSRLLTHSRTHTKEKPHKCQEPNCDFSASQKSILNRHQLTHPPKEGEEHPLFSCPICQFSSKTKGNLNNHIKSHILEKPLACSFESCEFRCKTKGHLNNHVKTHSEERQYKCELCPFRGKVRSTVTNHLKYVHSDPNHRLFKCPELNCQYSAKTNSSLNDHILTHKGEKKYSCSFPDCDYKAVKEYMIKRHQMAIHEIRERIKCNLCGFAAKTNATLVQHMRTHTKEKPFFCTENGCEYQARRIHVLRQHQKERHPQM